nr:MAG TPA: hypothetical protein [Caudoviricetes sp.]
MRDSARIRKPENIICLIRQPVGRSYHPFLVLWKGMVNMVTYSDLFTFVIMICAIITLARNGKDRK